jgi:hypothetical protein
LSHRRIALVRREKKEYVMRRVSLALCAAALTANAAHAATPADIGTTLSVVDVVTAEWSRERRSLTAGDGVRQDEIIEAAPAARSEFRLADDTRLALGPGARLVLDKFVYDPEKKAGDIAIDLTKGAFRFMTGAAKKPSYVVRVPNASITVRGTIFDVFVQANGTAWLLLHEGGVKVCNARGTCRILDEPGKLILVNDTGEIGKPFRWANLKDAQGFAFDDAFPFVATPPSIDPAPVFTKDALIQEPSKPKKPERKAELSPPASETPGAETVTKPKKPAKVVIRDPGGKRPGAKGGDEGPTRVVTKPPRRKTPKTEAKDETETRRKWKRIAEDAAGHWIDRVRARRVRDDGGSPLSLPPARSPKPALPKGPGPSKPELR